VLVVEFDDVFFDEFDFCGGVIVLFVVL